MNSLEITTELHSVDRQLADALSLRLSLDVDRIMFETCLEPVSSHALLIAGNGFGHDIYDDEETEGYELGDSFDITYQGETLLHHLTAWELKALRSHAKSWAEGYEI